MAWTTPKTWAGSELLTASDLNQYVRDNLSLLYELVSGGGRKNLLHNGAMQVAQRSTSVTLITAPGYNTADRWYTLLNTLGTWTQSVENDAPTGSGFRKSLKMLCTTADASPAAGDYARVTQIIEGQNLQSVLKGTASAKKLTLSFWTKSNKTGTYVASLYDADNTRHASATYTVTSSATWEQQTITFPVDLSGAFDNDNAASLYVHFWLAAGTDFTSGTLASTWASYTATNTAVGQTNLAASTNNYMQITGVQLETGDTATGYQHKNYDQDLAECQRYYYRHAEGNGSLIGPGFYYATTNLAVIIQPPVTMRTTPTSANVQGVGYFKTDPGADTFDSLTLTGTTSAKIAGFYNVTEMAAVAAAGYSCYVYTNNASAVVALTADL